MGYYINPPEGTKEDWLLRNGQEVIQPEWPPPKGQVIVCLVDNGPFRAAGICFDMKEWMTFVAPDAPADQIEAARQSFEGTVVAFYALDSGLQRPRRWYLVPRGKVLEVEPGVGYLLDPEGDARLMVD